MSNVNRFPQSCVLSLICNTVHHPQIMERYSSYNANINMPKTLEDIINEMTVSHPIVTEIDETPKKYTVYEKAGSRENKSLEDASESLKLLLGEPKVLFAEPEQLKIQEPSSSSHGVSPGVSSTEVNMDDQPWCPEIHSTTAPYMVKPSVIRSNIMPHTQLQESQQLLLSPRDKIPPSFTSLAIEILSDSNSCSSTKTENTTSDMFVNRGIVMSTAIAPLLQEEQEKEPMFFIKNILNDKMIDTNITTRISQQEEPVEITNPKSSLNIPLQKSKAIDKYLELETSDSDSNHRDKQKRLYDSSSKYKYHKKKKHCYNDLDSDSNHSDKQKRLYDLSTSSSSKYKYHKKKKHCYNDLDSDSNHSVIQKRLYDLSSSSSSKYKYHKKKNHCDNDLDSDSNHSDKQKRLYDLSSSSSSKYKYHKKKNHCDNVLDSDSNHSDKQKRLYDLSSSSSSKYKYHKKEKHCDNDLSYSRRPITLYKPSIDLHKKYSALAKSEKNDIDQSFAKPAKLERKFIPELVKKEELVKEPVVKKSNKKEEGLKNPFQPQLLKIKTKPLISSSTENDHETLKVIKKQRRRLQRMKSKVISAHSKLEEYSDFIRKSQIKDLTQNPHDRFSAMFSPRLISSDVDCSPPHKSVIESPPKLDSEGINVLDKNKRDTLRKLFVTRSKGKRGGKGGKGEIFIINKTKAMLNDNNKITSSEPDITVMPNEPESLNTSKLSIMCKIPLTKLSPKLNYLVKVNTKQVKKKQEHIHHKHHYKVSPSQIASRSDQSKSNKSPANTELLFQQFSCDGYSNDFMDSVDVCQKSSSVDAGILEKRVKPSSKSFEHSSMSYLQLPATTSETHDPYEETPEDKDTPLLSNSRTEVKISENKNLQYISSLGLDSNVLKRRKFHNPTGLETSGTYVTKKGDGLMNNRFVDPMHEVTVQPPTRQLSWNMQHQYTSRKRFISYFETDLYSENNMDHEVPLQEAQKLAKLAEYEPDPIIQEMKYLDGILCFVLCGHLMEKNGSRERELIKMFNDTFNSIKLIWSKIYDYRADCDYQEIDEIFEMADDPEKDNRLLIIWLRCLGYLRFKLYKLPIHQNRQNFKAVQQHFKNVCSSPVSKSSSPASVGESQSLGYYSSGTTHSCGAAFPGAATDMIDIPISIYSSIHSVHIQHCHLAAAHRMSQCADLLVLRGKHRQFFAEIDQHCGPLNFNSTGHNLTLYSRIAISRMRCELNIKNYLSLC